MRALQFFAKNEFLDPKNPQLAVLDIKIGQQTAKKDLLVKNRESGPVCNGADYAIFGVIFEKYA